ncbi:malto-oligosyltrehalose synthase [Chryseolinea sp. H1M3-3]|uniref:malto-oligosyltrehalose synthase n=1 Tax=Chryseolinea sp. H1M3-3 TaxID=3034144 RepID=UPI0023EB1437|nr:malto-oligosyltrehalose synthase [Chryseolinea sp. H1M3-3]
MRLPSSTYRVQLNKDFTFKNLLEIIDYLHALGVSTIYAAPILKSTKGSVHGYDVTDPHMIDPEIGTKEELSAIASKLRQRGMTWLQDIVPNHMAFDPANTRLMDVLERGPASPYYNYFDIDWNHPSPELKNKVMVPFLGDELAVCVKNNQIKLAFTRNGFQIFYFDAHYPVSGLACDFLFSLLDSPDVKNLAEEWTTFINGRAHTADLRTWHKLKSQWVASVTDKQKKTIQQMVESVNADQTLLMELLGRQHYVLTYWKRTEKEINYRRFFTVNQLICLRMEDDHVFKEYHAFLLSLYNENLIQGFRIDHIDGLKDPARYIKSLRKLFDADCYIIAEKILEAKETLPAEWPIQGTSGYEFLAYVNRLFTDKKGAKQLLEFYSTLVPGLPSYKQLVAKNKKMMLENYMGGEWDNLVRYLNDLELGNHFEYNRLKEALGIIMVSLPVYRIYPHVIPLTGNDLDVINETFEKARKVETGCTEELEHFQQLFVSETSYPKANILSFLKRLMQFTGPLTAKGVEDTTFYIYNPLISHDEVGDSPSTLAISISEFHKRMIVRQQNTPLSLNATATHDTKRGEDVRIRLNVLSEIPEQWQQVVSQWFADHQSYLAANAEDTKVSINDEYFIYQSIVGGFPEDLVASVEWMKRLQEYLMKVVREAKVKSNWELPNENYEKACSTFIQYLLTDEKKFLPSAITFVRQILDAATTYALGQVLLKVTAPGIPDIYQGCELWDLSYVDPDNRRAVDYKLRKKYFDQILIKEKEGSDALFSFLTINRNMGVEKLFVTWKTLTFRKNHEALFTEGAYIPLQVTGGNQLACVYARNIENKWILVAVPFGITQQNQATETLDLHAEESIVMLEYFPKQWINLFSGKSVISNGYLPLKELYKDFSVALLYSV